MSFIILIEIKIIHIRWCFDMYDYISMDHDLGNLLVMLGILVLLIVFLHLMWKCLLSYCELCGGKHVFLLWIMSDGEIGVWGWEEGKGFFGLGFCIGIVLVALSLCYYLYFLTGVKFLQKYISLIQTNN